MSKFVTTPDGVRHPFSNDATPEEIKTALAAYVSRGASPAPGAMTATNNPAASRLASLRSRALKLLPDAGGTAGGIAGGIIGGGATIPVGGGGAIPGAMVGAAVGGGTGEALRQKLSGEQFSRREIEKRAGEQGLYEGAGGGIAKGAGKLARPFMGKALGNVAALAKRFKTTSKGVAEVLLENKLPVTEAGAHQAIGKGAAVRRSRSARIDAVPSTIGAGTLADVAISDSERNLGQRLTRSERAVIVAQVEDEANRILTARTHGAVPKGVPGRPTRYTARETEQIKEVAAKNARPEYRAAQAAATVAADPALSKQLASGARKRLNKIPGVEADNQQIKNMMLAEQSITNAVVKEGDEWTALKAGPISVLGIQVPRAQFSRIALWLDSPRTQAMLRQSPRTVAAVLKQMIHADTTGSRHSAVASARAGSTPDTSDIIHYVPDAQGNLVPAGR